MSSAQRDLFDRQMQLEDQLIEAKAPRWASMSTLDLFRAATNTTGGDIHQAVALFHGMSDNQRYQVARKMRQLAEDTTVTDEDVLMSFIAP